jgi:hypothetical protein
MFPENFATWLAAQSEIITQFGINVYWGELPAKGVDQAKPSLIWWVDDSANSVQTTERKSAGASYVVSMIASASTNRGDAWKAARVAKSLLRQSTSLTLPGDPATYCQSVKFLGISDSLDDQLLSRGLFMASIKFSFYIGSEED